MYVAFCPRRINNAWPNSLSMRCLRLRCGRVRGGVCTQQYTTTSRYARRDISAWPPRTHLYIYTLKWIPRRNASSQTRGIQKSGGLSSALTFSNFPMICASSSLASRSS